MYFEDLKKKNNRYKLHYTFEAMLITCVLVYRFLSNFKT